MGEKSNFLPFISGLILSGAIIAFAHWMRFDRERSFYPTVLIVIASYYLLFAVIGNATFITLVAETLLASLFLGLAAFGAFRSMAWVGLGLILHGLLDSIHPAILQNPGVPAWWPAFCAAVDLSLGVWVVWLVSTESREKEAEAASR